ncbi:MAG TPA: Rrf2 family transcriptional regulator [Phycisphaerales bacterium]|nr:Rrf2 family transcriptional regulator [Phycisphaerales bacterium]
MLSQGVGYAILALGHIASSGGNPVLVKEIAEAASIPAPYLAKIIHALGKRGLVLTQRGVGGGVTLARPATEISLHDVCLAMDDPVVRPTCMLGNATCSDDRACPAHKFWTAHRAKVYDFLKMTSVADIASFEARRRWKSSLGTPGVSLPMGSTPTRPQGSGISLPTISLPPAAPPVPGAPRPDPSA